jgi:hypothetical protein
VPFCQTVRLIVRRAMSVLASPAEPLLDMLTPHTCPECGQLLLPQGTDVANALASLFATGMQQLLAPMAGTAAMAGSGVAPMAHRQAHRHRRGEPAGYYRRHGYRDCGCGDRGHAGCGHRGHHGRGHGRGWQAHDTGQHWRREWGACDDGCRCCEDESCECQCCIPKCDLLVYARAGETRVVPLVIENHRHRERHITLQIGSWKAVGSSGADVTTVDLKPADFELKACSRETARLTFSVGGREQQDVETCTVACADLTVDGCDMKPLRIAVAILPLECGPYRVDCSCGCC